MRPARLILLLALLAATLLAGTPDLRAEITCDACGDPIQDSYVTADGKHYHPDHFTCTLCRKPLIGGYVTHGEGRYHARCYEENLAEKCDVCGRPLQGTFLKDHWGNSYHPSHKDHLPQCEYCSRILSDATSRGGFEYEDGRTICGICSRDAITRESQALALMQEVARKLRRIGLAVDTPEFDLHMVDLGKMREVTRGRSHDTRGFTTYQEESVLGLMRRQQTDVFLLHGMPREDAIATLAHELTHVWQALNGRLDIDEAFSEGSCNYAAWLVLQEYTSGQAGYLVLNMMENQDRVYGEGFRRVKRYAEKEGHAAWLDRLRNHDRLPRGY